MMRRYLPVLTVLTTLLALTTPAFTQTVLFGPKQYTRTAGPPNQFTDTFTLPSGTTPPYTLHVVNGNANGTNRISSATVTLNGTQILGPSDFGQNVAVIDRTITPQASNTLEIRLTSAPGSFLTLTVLDTSAGSQPTALTPNPLNLNAGATGTLTAMLAPAPTAAGSLTVSSANPAVATVSASVSFTSGQTSVPVTVTAVASGSTTITVTLNGASAASQVTVMPPPPTIISFTPTSGTVGTTVTITGTDFINVQSVTLNGSAAIFTINNATTITAVVPSGATTGKIVIAGSAGTAASATNFTVLVPSAVTSFTPTSGPIGTTVIITGQNFDAVAANNQVKFNGAPAIISAASATQIMTVVPQGATTGPITVTTSLNTATSATNFTVQASADFQISAAPATVTAVQDHTTLVLLQLTSAAGFANLVNLTATIPSGSGVTATFSAPVVTLFQPVTLTLTTSAATPVGTIPVTVTGSTTIDGQPIARAAVVNLSVLAAGNTTFSGRVLREQDAAPLVGVTLRLGSLTAVTDATGQFFFASAPVGTQIMTIDGSTVAAPSGTAYSTLPAQVTLLANQHNELSFVPYLPAVDTTVFSVLDPAHDSVIATPSAPGLRVTIPAGVELRSDVDGSLIMKVSVQPVSPDRIPVPPPSDPTMHVDPVTIYRFYFHKPGGAIPSQPISNFAIPNDAGLPPGTDMLVYYFDGSSTVTPGSNQWRVAGTGTVTVDGTQVVPNPGTAIPKLCCPLIYVCPVLTDLFIGPNAGNASGGDPVDLATGQLMVTKTDLVLPGRIPITISRTYQSGRKDLGGLFGRGTSFVYDRALLGTGGGNGVLYQQGNGRIDLLSQQPDGTYQNLSLPPLRGLVLTLGTTGSIIRRKDGSIERYANGRLVEIVDRAGSTLTITRNGLGPVTITNAPGRVLTFQYDAAGRITRITDPLGRAVQYAYNAVNLLETVTDPAGGVTQYTYDSLGNLLAVVDPRNITYLTNQYDAKNRVIQQTLADGGIYRFQYTTFGDTITETRVTDPRGQTTTTRFTAQRYAASQGDALGLVFGRTFNLKNEVTETRDPQNRLTQYTYDAAGNVTSITDPNNQVTRFEYHPVWNRATKITDALNQITEFTYDDVGNLITVKDPLNHTTTLAYNAFGQPLTVTDPLSQTTTFIYDPAGNLLTATDSLGNATERTYDLANRLVKLTDPRGFTATFAYDTVNRVAQITDALNGLTQFTYDPNGNLLTVTDAENHTTTYTYDSMDRLATRKDALNRTESYQYDLAGNLTTFTDRKGQVTTFQYDALNRRTQATYPDATTTFTYDTVGRLVKASDTATGAGTIDFAYDTLDRLIQEVTGQGSVSYQYDVLGRRTQMTANGQQPVTYGYDAVSRLTQVAQGSLAVGLGYDNANRRTSLTYPNGTSTGYTYDVASRLTNINHIGPSGIIEALTYAYDPAGNRTSLTRNNGTASLLPAAVPSATYDAANEQTSFAGAALTYDNNGNLTSDGVNTYAWDARNRLIGISGGTTATFAYDSLGRRASKTINSVASQFLYDGNDIVAEIGGGAVGVNYLRSLNIDEPFIRETGTGNEHYHTDALGSSLALSNVPGGSATTYTYEPFGKAMVTGTSPNAFQYTGRENDGAGLSYYRARYYSPSRQRFISEDSLSLARIIRIMQNNQSQFVEQVYALTLFEPSLQNEFAYVTNNPITYRDPLGYQRGVLPALSGGTGDAVGSVAGAVVGASAGAAAGAATGMRLGFVVGGALGLGAGPLGSLGGAIVGGVVGQSIGGVVGGFVGGNLGGQIGSLIDNRCAGSLNCGEDELLRERMSKMGKRK